MEIPDYFYISHMETPTLPPVQTQISPVGAQKISESLVSNSEAECLKLLSAAMECIPANDPRKKDLLATYIVILDSVKARLERIDKARNILAENMQKIGDFAQFMHEFTESLQDETEGSPVRPDLLGPPETSIDSDMLSDLKSFKLWQHNLMFVKKINEYTDSNLYTFLFRVAKEMAKEMAKELDLKWLNENTTLADLRDHILHDEDFRNYLAKTLREDLPDEQIVGSDCRAIDRSHYYVYGGAEGGMMKEHLLNCSPVFSEYLLKMRMIHRDPVWCFTKADPFVFGPCTKNAALALECMLNPSLRRMYTEQLQTLEDCFSFARVFAYLNLSFGD
jgi:hypothetical protein